ncbi:MFS general substrate transporter [Lactarius quietus]|nr:MFS general substrate transporter [Lactarius quietus]
MRHVWRKIDIHLLPLAALLYLLSFLDRINIGKHFLSTRRFAYVAGMEVDLHLNGLQFNIATAILFIPYCLVEAPSNVILRLVRPSRWITFTMLVWGTIMSLMCLVNSYHGLLVARFFLGLAEGGLLPGLTYYLSLWYPRQMQSQRLGVFVTAAATAGAFGGILSYGIKHLDGKAGLHGWQWIFLITGLLTVAVALPSYFFIQDYPESATFLTEKEKQFVIQTLVDDSKGQASHLSAKSVWQALADWKTHVHCLISLCIFTTGYTVALFTPTIVHDLGYSAANAELLSAPPFLCAGIFTMIICFFSDKFNSRGPFVVFCSTLSMIGYIIAYTTSKPGPGYVAIVFAACGAYPNVALLSAWAGGNAGGNMKRGIVIALTIGFGNFGGIVASFIYYQPPRFHTGHGTVIGCLGLSIICSCIMMWTYKRLNKEKEEQCAREGIDESMKDQYRDLADESPLFR